MMKNLILVIVMTVLTVEVFAQNDAITKFFNKYSSDESFTQVNVSSKMFGLFTKMDTDDPEDKEVLDAISKLKGLRIIAKQDARNARQLYDEAFKLIPSREYEELMSFRDKDKDMKFLIKEQNGKISELLMVMGGSTEFMILSLFGEIDLKQVSKIGKKMDVKGLENLQNINGDKDKDKKKDYTK